MTYTSDDQAVDRDMNMPDARASRKHLQKVLATIQTPHGAKEFWRLYDVFGAGIAPTWAATNKAITSAGRCARGVDMLAPDTINARNQGGVNPSDYKNGARTVLHAALVRGTCIEQMEAS